MSVTILVVDDASFVRDLVKRTVRKLLPQVNLLEAQNGSRAQSLIRRQSVDLILSDWEMPEMSGEALLRWVRQEEKTATTPFVMITSRGDRSHVVQAINAGVNDYLTKPFTADELVRKLLKQFKRMGVKINDNKENDSFNTAFDSVGVLTGSAQSAAPERKGWPGRSGEANAPAKEAKAFNGRASIRFASAGGACEVRDISLQAITGVISRDVGLPSLFESAAVDLESADGETVVRLNAYVHALQAAQPHPECDQVKVVLRFVDKDPAKLETLSKFLTKR
jgi:CheY-like chemotaxis protein